MVKGVEGTYVIMMLREAPVVFRLSVYYPRSSSISLIVDIANVKFIHSCVVKEPYLFITMEVPVIIAWSSQNPKP